jgi:hypothetical protein
MSHLEGLKMPLGSQVTLVLPKYPAMQVTTTVSPVLPVIEPFFA